ncbi:MAG TPA: hypothetical protein VF399_09580 [bacterium]
MIKIDRTMKLLLAWIAFALTIIALKMALPDHALMAQETLPSVSGPLQVVISEPVPVKIVDWNAYPSQPFKVKIDDPWPARVEIMDEVKIKGELRLQQ